MRTWSSSSRRSVPAKRSAKAFHVRRANRRAHEAHPRRPEYASEASAELRVVVADDNLWRVIHGGVPGLLRAPPRAMPPERVESCVMPAKNGRGLDEQDCVTPSWRHSCREDNHEALPGSPPNTTGELRSATISC